MLGIYKGISCVQEAPTNRLLHLHIVIVDSASSTLLTGSPDIMANRAQMVDLRADIPPHRYFWLDHTLSVVSGHLPEDHLLLAVHLAGHGACQICLEELAIQIV